MADSWVRVDGPVSRDVYVNNVIEPSGRTRVPFRVELGQNTFFLLDDTGGIEAQTTVIVPAAPRQTPFRVGLRRIS